MKTSGPPIVDATLRSIVEGTASARGEHLFRSLVQYLAISLNAKCAFVAEFTLQCTAVRTLAVWVDDQHQANMEFELEGTPCKNVAMSGAIQHFADGVQETFPTNEILKSLNARSYLAIPMIDGGGKVIGHLAVIDDRPMPADERALSIFHIFAARATAELIQRRTEHELDDTRLREQRLRTEQERMAAEVAYLREELRSRSDFAEIVGKSDAIWKVLRNIDLVAATDSTVLILGETGTGKELVAKAIHKMSRREHGPFVRVNCAALAESLLESELFGHESGAFTGATTQRLGRFELAEGGTVFLDEIGEMPLAAQTRLLRVLQEHELERVGGSQTIRVNARVLAATNRKLLEMVEAGTFREDLYYRLNVFPISVPPLRERPEDIPSLVRLFLKKLGPRLGKKVHNVSDDVCSMLRGYAWPGNVRELENVIERAMILTQGTTLALPDGAIPIHKRTTPRSLQLLPLDQVERDHIRAVLDHTRGVIAGPHGAAQILGLNPNTLRSRMEKLGVVSARTSGSSSDGN